MHRGLNCHRKILCTCVWCNFDCIHALCEEFRFYAMHRIFNGVFNGSFDVFQSWWEAGIVIMLCILKQTQKYNLHSKIRMQGFYICDKTSHLINLNCRLHRSDHDCIIYMILFCENSNPVHIYFFKQCKVIADPLQVYTTCLRYAMGRL